MKGSNELERETFLLHLHEQQAYKMLFCTMSTLSQLISGPT